MQEPPEALGVRIAFAAAWSAVAIGYLIRDAFGEGIRLFRSSR